jgi:hypothetical protein
LSPLLFVNRFRHKYINLSPTQAVRQDVAQPGWDAAQALRQDAAQLGQYVAQAVQQDAAQAVLATSVRRKIMQLCLSFILDALQFPVQCSESVTF